MTITISFVTRNGKHISDKTISKIHIKVIKYIMYFFNGIVWKNPKPKEIQENLNLFFLIQFKNLFSAIKAF